jgi:hypothetical protein
MRYVNMFGFVLLFVFSGLHITRYYMLLYKILVVLDQKPLICTYDVKWFHDNVKTLHRHSMSRTY